MSTDPETKETVTEEVQETKEETTEEKQETPKEESSQTKEILEAIKNLQEEYKQTLTKLNDELSKTKTELKEFKDEEERKKPLKLNAYVKGRYDFDKLVQSMGLKTVDEYKEHCRKIYNKINGKYNTVNNLTA